MPSTARDDVLNHEVAGSMLGVIPLRKKGGKKRYCLFRKICRISPDLENDYGDTIIDF